MIYPNLSRTMARQMSRKTTPGELGELRSCPTRPELQGFWPFRATMSSTSREFRQTLVDVGQPVTNLRNARLKLANGWPTLNKFGSSGPDLAKRMPDIGQGWPNVAQHVHPRRDFGQLRRSPCSPGAEFSGMHGEPLFGNCSGNLTFALPYTCSCCSLARSFARPLGRTTHTLTQNRTQHWRNSAC